MVELGGGEIGSRRRRRSSEAGMQQPIQDAAGSAAEMAASGAGTDAGELARPVTRRRHAASYLSGSEQVRLAPVMTRLFARKRFDPSS